MANTIKFGDGQWATKGDSILAYNDENANFKPLPFVTSRATTATRVNKAGLLETVANGVPRVDYLGNSKGSYLTEGSSTNLITQSEGFSDSYWTKEGATIKGDASTAGSELVTNGDFATDTDWTKGTGVTISGGEAVLTSAPNAEGALSQVDVVELGKNYEISFTVSDYVEGGVYILRPTNLGGGYAARANGTYTFSVYSETSTGLTLYTGGNTTLSINNVSVKEVQGFSAPSVDSPLGVFKLVENTSTGHHATWPASAVTVTANTDVTFTSYVKKIDRRYIAVGVSHNRTIGAVAQFDLDTQSLVYSGGIGDIYTYVSSDIKSLGNDWYRLEFVCQTTGTSIRPSIALSDDIFTNPSILNSANFYTGDGTSGVYIFGAQLEQQSHATSYIKTSGTAITRTKETASETGISSLIGQTEGVLYAEISKLANIGGAYQLSLSNGSHNENIKILYLSTSTVRFEAKMASGSDFVFNISVNDLDFNKFAIQYKANDYKVFYNGLKQTVSQVANTPIGLNKLSFDRGDGVGDFYGKVKDLRVFNTALTDAELATLTTI